ncbi:MAG: DUF305 domain-containing protein [Hyphomicrobiales bacterium]
MNRHIVISGAAAAALVGASALVIAQDNASQSYTDAMKKMMDSMHIEPTGDADKDFVMMMIPHHHGAIDMAKVELQYGKDEQLRKMAQDVIAAQEKEIATMREWQSKHQ